MRHKIRILPLIVILIFSQIESLSAQPNAIDTTVTESIIDVAYGSQPAWMVNSAISSTQGSELLNSFTLNNGNRLSGRIAGLTVLANQNEPGNDNPALYIRGLNTYGTGTGVLIIVDGVESSYADLVPEEIETMSILKDASALALYGSRGANGVMLVTTKKGAIGPLKVNFGIQGGFKQATRLPDFLGSYDYANLFNEALINEGREAVYNESDLDAFRDGSDQYFHPDVDWYDEILRNNSPITNYNLNFRGGNTNSKFFVLMNLASDDGLYKRTGDAENSVDQAYSRLNFRSNLDMNISKTFNFKFNLGAQIQKKANPNANTTASMFDLLSQLPPNAFPVYNPDSTYGANSLYSNPLGDVLEKGFYTSNSRSIQITSTATQKLDFIAKGLSASLTGSFNNYFSSWSNKSRDYVRYAISRNVTGDTIYNAIGQNTTLSASENAQRYWNNWEWQASIDYKNSFGSSDVNAMLMYSEYTNDGASVAIPYRYNGIRGRFTYALSRKYIAEVAFAYNGTENFPQGKRWGLFPAMSLGWIASNENFLKQNNSISYLKIRGSYGLTGNDDIGGTRFMFNPQSYIGGGNYFFGSTNASYNSTVEGKIRNPNVTWEKEKKLNVGLDATLFSRLDVIVDVFNNDRYDILSTAARTVPDYLGFGTLPDLNVGKTNNKGFEAVLTFNSKPQSKFGYFISASVWYAKNKVVYNAEPIQLWEYLYRTGHPINQPFRLEAIGFFRDQDDINNSPIPIFDEVKPGDIKYADQNGDNIIDQNDIIPIGFTGIPQWSGGFETGINYKGFDLNIFLQGVTNRSVFLSGYYYEAFQNNGKVSSIALGRWTEANAENATYPRLTASNNLNNYRSSSFWLRDGSFIKLRNIEIGYTLKGIEKINLDYARFFINGTNLFSLDYMEFTDPENQTGYPSQRTISIGARFQF